jgi:hypothetical protein
MLADATHADKIRLLILRAGKTRELTIDANR